MTRHPLSLMSLSGNGRKSLAFRLILQYYKLEIRNKLLLNPNIEIRNKPVLSRVEGFKIRITKIQNSVSSAEVFLFWEFVF